MSEIKLSPEAFRAVMSSVLTGPNCTTRGSLISYGVPKKPVSLSSLSKHLDEGPDTFLTVYAATNHKFKKLIQNELDIRLEASDIAQAYCLDHIEMVRVGEFIFKDKGASDPYFSMLLERGFILKEADLPAYLYSCIGKPGRVTSLRGTVASVATAQCVLDGVIVSKETKKGDWVAVHFATAIATISESEAKELQKEQLKHSWFKALVVDCPKEIDYENFCGANLSAYAKKRLRMLNKKSIILQAYEGMLRWFKSLLTRSS